MYHCGINLLTEGCLASYFCTNHTWYGEGEKVALVEIYLFIFCTIYYNIQGIFQQVWIEYQIFKQEVVLQEVEAQKKT
jgi:hypothetical protein